MNVVLLAPHRARVTAGIYASAAILAAIVGLVAVQASRGLYAVTVIVWALTAIVAAAIDMRTGRLLNIFVLPGTACVVGLSFFAGKISGALVGALILGLPMLIAHLARPSGLGFGDVKLGILLGAGIGVVAAPLALLAYLLAAVAHAAVCVVVRARGRLVPFGPALAGASILIVVSELLGRL